MVSEPRWLECDPIALGEDTDDDELCYCGADTAKGCTCDD